MSGAVSVERSVTLVIPGEPAYSLSPNSRSHWAVKQRETKDARWAVRCAFPGEVPGIGEVVIPGPVRLRWIVYLAKRGKRRDADNMLASLKAHQDALAYWGVIGGDSPKFIPDTPTVDQIVWSDHKSDPRIVVTIEEATQP
jgi:Holliday junction resolvase RusA-like endonuclease